MTRRASDAMEAQVAYYNARAAEDDAWYQHSGRWDRGPAANAAWFEAIAEAQHELGTLLPVGSALDVACGSGTWTVMLAAAAKRVTALDGSKRMLEMASDRLAEFRNVTYVCENLVTFDTDRRFDLVVMAFWLSHLPLDLQDDFWDRASSWLAPKGTLFIVDHRSTEETATPVAKSRSVHVRVWDGVEYPVVKVPVESRRLELTLKTHGMRASLREVGDLTIGIAVRATP